MAFTAVKIIKMGAYGGLWGFMWVYGGLRGLMAAYGGLWRLFERDAFADGKSVR